MGAIETNDSKLRSWVEVPADSDFPIQNLPFGIFKAHSAYGAGVAIGEFIVDLRFLHENGYLAGLALPPGVFAQMYLNDFLALGRQKVRDVRNRISSLLQHGNDTLTSQPAVRENVLIPQMDVEMLLPVRAPNYTDFYSSEAHAFNIGSMFRDPENALPPNWKFLPVGYHGRASSIVASGTDIRRPKGQIRSPDKSSPVLSSTRKLDFELELAFITCSENALGHPVPIEEAEDYIAGLVLFNDWSARDIQQLEYVPLGPFLGKSFGSTMSPWMVTLDALEPFRVAGPLQDPQVLPYLAFSGKKNFDIALEVVIQAQGGSRSVLSRSNAKYLYWNICQQLAHQTVNGCNVQVGDVYASGTISGPAPGSYGSMLELSWNGERPLRLADGSERAFLEDGDTVIMRAYAERDGTRIGFGECRGTIVPA